LLESIAQATATATQGDINQHNNVNIPAIIGGTVGSIVLLFQVVALLAFWRYRRKRERRAFVGRLEEETIVRPFDLCRTTSVLAQTTQSPRQECSSPTRLIQGIVSQGEGGVAGMVLSNTTRTMHVTDRQLSPNNEPGEIGRKIPGERGRAVRTGAEDINEDRVGGEWPATDQTTTPQSLPTLDEAVNSDTAAIPQEQVDEPRETSLSVVEGSSDPPPPYSSRV
jgi:hypothetical protein